MKYHRPDQFTCESPFSGKPLTKSCPSTLLAISAVTDFNVCSRASTILRCTIGNRRAKRNIASLRRVGISKINKKNG
jgi:hypothetical protein